MSPPSPGKNETDTSLAELQSSPSLPKPSTPETQLIWSYLAKAFTETQAMALALGSL